MVIGLGNPVGRVRQKARGLRFLQANSLDLEAIELLPRLFGKVLVPEIVRIELDRPRTPAPVRTWLRTNSAWLEQRAMPPGAAFVSPKLGEGEQAALALVHAVGATLILMDDRVAATARAQGLAATGTLGMLELAAVRDLIDLPAALTRLKATNFRYRPELLEILLARHHKRRSGS